jgi:hypothetical protein
MATAYEVDQWKDRCRRLTALLDKSRREKEELTRRIRDNSEEAKTARAIADGLEWEVEDLKAENAELRELVRDMWRDGMCDCDECGAFVQGEYHCAQCEYHFPDRMRELGIEIEVDDD